MQLSDLSRLGALDAAAAVRAREVSPTELVDDALERAHTVGAQLGAFVRLTEDTARQQARTAEQAVLAARDPGELPPLLGVPTAIKDLNMVAGVPTAFGSRAMHGFVPDYDDHVVTLLHAAGTISIGKTATPEFGLPCYTETDIGPPALTPWDTGTARLAGGSSGGAAAAVAGGVVPVAQGSDGGGSIRIPASACGLVGVKTSRGRVSKGPNDLDSTRLSVLGPLARTVRDAAAFLDAVARPMPGDPDPLPIPEQTFLSRCEREPGRLVVGRFIDSPMRGEVDDAVRSAWEQASVLLAGLGHEVVDTLAPLPVDAVPLFETVWAVSAASFPVPGGEELLRPLTRHLRERGRAATAPQFAAALAQLNVLARRAVASTAQFDVLMCPTVAMVPRPVGWFTRDDGPAADFERQKQYTPYTAMFNLTGQPAVSLPLYRSADGLPIGIMLVGRPAAEPLLFSLAAQLERALPWPLTPTAS